MSKNQPSRSGRNAKRSKIKPSKLPVVGIGTSAGGLEALKVFFENLPDAYPFALVIVQHLSPDYKSLMVDVLSRNTGWSIQEVEDGTPVQPGKAYLIPANKNMTLQNGKLHLRDKPAGHHDNLPIDTFFNSLAEDRKQHAIGVVLSGVGADGAKGLRAIKDAGGILMVQDPGEAQYDSMPNNAIATGLVDEVLSVSEIPAALLRYTNDPTTNGMETDENKLVSSKHFQRLLAHVHKITKVDFSDYKPPTLTRRVLRRMGVTKSDTLRDYLDYVYDHEEETRILYREFLIGVTRFFRDKEAFEFLQGEIIPGIAKSKKGNDPIKLWTVGCSSGEEAYSLGILLQEYLEITNTSREVKIFATDLDREVVQKANKGMFTETMVAEVSQERLTKYFIKKDDGYQVSPLIRKMIIFSDHNAVEDPPLTNMDLVVCRNLLIYLQPSLQQKLLASLHYAILPNKYLFLGPSESIGKFSVAFKVMSRKWKIYQNVDPARTIRISEFKHGGASPALFPALGSVQQQSRLEQQFSDMLAESLLEEFGAASAYIDGNFELLSADGKFKHYLQLPASKFRSLNVLKMLPQSLSLPLSTAMRKADQEKCKVTVKELLYQHRERAEKVTLVVHPARTTAGGHQKLYLVLFIPERVDDPVGAEDHAVVRIAPDTLEEFKQEKVLALEQDLLDTRIHLQNTLEEVETANEALQATNAELEASNEELQSTNEELHSVNEELHTVNSEHQYKIEELAQVNADLENLMTSTEIGTIFLDKDLAVRKFTPSISRFFHVIDSDIGRPISHFNFAVGEHGGNDLIADSKAVMNTGNPVEKEVHLGAGNWYLQRIHPFMNGLNAIEGVAISFVNITPQKKMELELQQTNKFLHKVTDVVPGIIYVFNQETQSNEYANRQLVSLLGFGEQEIQQMGGNLLENLIHPDDLPGLLKHFDDIKAARDGTTHQVEYRIKHKKGYYKWFMSQATMFERDAQTGAVKNIGVASDITTLKEAEQQIRESNHVYNTIIEGTMAGYWDWHIADNYNFMSPTYKSMLGYAADEIPPDPEWWSKNTHPEDVAKFLASYKEHVSTRGARPVEEILRFYHKDGSTVWISCRSRVIEWNDQGQPLRMVGSHVDITPLKRVEEKLQRAYDDLEQKVIERTALLKKTEEKYRSMYENTPDMLASVSLEDATVIECNNTLLQNLGYAKEQVIGQPVFRLYHPDCHEMARQVFKARQTQGEVNNAELLLQRKDGTTIPVILNVASVSDDQGKVVHTLSAWRDITEIKKVMRELEQFAYITTHDIKAPITNIENYLNLLKKDPALQEGRSLTAVEWIDTSVQRAKKTIEDLLLVVKSRKETGVIAEPVELKEVLEHAKQALQSEIEASSATITADFKQGAVVHFTRLKAESLLQNLLSNAIKYREPERPLKIALKTTETKEFICLSVKDNGIGIDLKNDEEKVFGLFKRAHAHISGSGIGLYLTKQSVEAQGGQMKVKSTPGRGSTFTVYFKKQ